MLKKLALALLLALFGAPVIAQSIEDHTAAGKSLYFRLCRQCHGVNMVNSGAQSFDLRKFPADDFARFQNSVMNGKRNMPPWADIVSEEDLVNLWAYVATKAGTKPLPEVARGPFEEKHSALAVDPASAEFDTIKPDTLTVCLARNGTAMSGWRHDSGVGLDYRVSVALAETLGRSFAALWFDAEGKSNPLYEPSALMSNGMCDLVAGHPLVQSAVGKPMLERGRVPKWVGRPLMTDARKREMVPLHAIDVTAPFRREELGVVLAPSAGLEDVTRLIDLAGLRIAYQNNTLGEVVLRLGTPDEVRNGGQSYPAGSGLLWKLEAGEADAAIVEVSAFDFMRRQNPITKLTLASWRHKLGINVGFAVLADNVPLRDAVNAGLAQLEASGVYPGLAAKDDILYIAPRAPHMLTAVTQAQLIAAK